MSILDKIKKQPPDSPGKKLFAIVSGPRLGGKTTLAGSLPNTLLLQAAVLESGSGSAKELARRNGNNLTIYNFASVDELNAILNELKTSEDYDNIYVDGYSAVTELKYKDPKIQMAIKKNTWDGFRDLSDAAGDVMTTLKQLTYPEYAKKPRNIWLTCALKVKLEANGNIANIELDTKGNAPVSYITKLGEAVITALPGIRTEAGVGPHRLLTKSDGVWPARIDGLLADQNPGAIEPADLTQVLKLLKIS